MVRKLTLGLFLAGAALVQLAAPTEAEEKKCVEGTTATGECVPTSLAVRTRNRALILAQPKFSYSAPAYLPDADYDPAIPREHIRELNALFGAPFGF